MPITFLSDIYTNVLSIENADNEQNNLFKELSDFKVESQSRKYLLQNT